MPAPPPPRSYAYQTPILALNAPSSSPTPQVKALLKAVAEYKTAARIMVTAKAHPADDAPRQMELAAYMTHCALEPAHLMLALNLAMSVTFKHGNYIHAAGFARRMLELPDISAAKNAALATKVRSTSSAADAAF